MTQFCWGKQSFVCPESLSVSVLQVIQLEVLLELGSTFYMTKPSQQLPSGDYKYNML